MVVGDQPGLVGRHLLVQQSVHRPAKGLEHVTLLNHVDALKGLDVGRVDGEEPGKLVQTLGHAAVKGRELAQVLGDAGHLLVGLAEQPVGDDVGDVLAGDAHLLEAVAHPAQLLGDEGKAGAVEERLLQATEEAEGRQRCHLAQLAQEAQVEDELALLARAQVVEQLVDDEEDAVVGVALLEGGDRGDDGILVVRHLVGRREREGRPPVLERDLQFPEQDVAQAAGHATDLGPGDFEAAGDRAGGLPHLGVVQVEDEIRVFGSGGNDRHQVGLARAIVADDEDALVVARGQELELGDDDVGELVGHAVGDDVGLDQAASGVLPVGVAELDDGLDGIELDQITVAHCDSFQCCL